MLGQWQDLEDPHAMLDYIGSSTDSKNSGTRFMVPIGYLYLTLDGLIDYSTINELESGMSNTAHPAFKLILHVPGWYEERGTRDFEESSAKKTIGEET
jgi:hypothetical protein